MLVLPDIQDLNVKVLLKSARQRVAKGLLRPRTPARAERTDAAVLFVGDGFDRVVDTPKFRAHLRLVFVPLPVLLIPLSSLLFAVPLQFDPELLPLTGLGLPVALQLAQQLMTPFLRFRAPGVLLPGEFQNVAAAFRVLPQPFWQLSLNGVI